MFKKSDFILDEAVEGEGGIGYNQFIEDPDETPTAEDMDFINDGPIDYFQGKTKKQAAKR